MWECGLKHRRDLQGSPEKRVTPYVGVWIETRKVAELTGIDLVTPYVGVWIETYHGRCSCTCAGVTPYVGVWIETSPVSRKSTRSACHSLCGSVD